MFNLKFATCAVATAALLTPGMSQAAPTIYTDQTAFMAAITSPATDTYDDFGTTGPGPLLPPLPLPRTVGSYAYQANASNGLFKLGPGVPGDYWLSVGTAADHLVLDNFSANVQGVGGFFFATDNPGSPASADVTVVASDGATTTYTLSPGGPGTFVGFISNSGIQSIDIVASQDSADRFPTINDLTLGQTTAVPEPGTYALALFGLAAVAGTVSGRRRKTG